MGDVPNTCSLRNVSVSCLLLRGKHTEKALAGPTVQLIRFLIESFLLFTALESIQMEDTVSLHHKGHQEFCTLST